MPYDLYPAVDQNYDFPPEVRVALSKSMELRNDVEPMTTVLRNNLQASEKWDGRVIANTDTDRLERYDAGTSTWKEIAETAASDGKYVVQAGGTMTADPTVALGVSTKQYTDKITSVQTGNRNVIFNGDMQVSQRGDVESPLLTSGSVRLVDGYFFAINGPGQRTVARKKVSLYPTLVPLTSSQYVYEVSFAGTSGANDHMFLWQAQENVKTLAGKTVTLSFLGSCSQTPNLKVGISTTQVFGTGAGSPSANVNTAHGQIAFTTPGVWQKYSLTFTIPSVAGKTIGTDGSDYFALAFWVSAGTNFAGQSSNVGVQTNSIKLTDIQLEEGSVATPFERLALEEQLAKCQRYFRRLGFVNPHTPGTHPSYTFSWGAANSATDQHTYFPLSPTMRCAPTFYTPGVNKFYINDLSGNWVPTTMVSTSGTTADMLSLTCTVSGGTMTPFRPTRIMGQDNSAYMDLSCEI